MTMCCRFVLVLLFMCVADSESRGVDNFLECSEFFYQKQSPSFSSKHANIKHICQHFGGKDHFATMYLPEYRIPLFSAYRLEIDRTGPKNKQSAWFIEPHLVCSDTFQQDLNMVPVENLQTFMEKTDLNNVIKQILFFMKYREDDQPNQAVNKDYWNTNYDRGHLNPAFYHFGDARKATYTLTNAVPQDPTFNQKNWKDMEQLSKKIMEIECKDKGDQRFFVTGVIPSNMFIPFPEHDGEGYQQRDYYRVNVPSAMWTAACCDAGPYAESFSFSYYGQNGPNSYIMAMPITRLHYLLRLNGLDIQIFHDNCLLENVVSKRALGMLVKAAQSTNAHSFAKMYIDHALQKHTYWL